MFIGVVKSDRVTAMTSKDPNFSVLLVSGK